MSWLISMRFFCILILVEVCLFMIVVIEVDKVLMVLVVWICLDRVKVVWIKVKFSF